MQLNRSRLSLTHVLLFSLIFIAFGSPGTVSAIGVRSGEPDSLLDRSIVRASSTKEPIPCEEIDAAHSRRTFVVYELRDDLSYLLGQRDFYQVVGGIGLAPTVFGSAFRNESPEFTELWGASNLADNFFEVGETVGNGAFPVVASVASWGVGRLVGAPRLSRFGSNLFRAQVINGLLTAGMKVSINRTRPNGAS